MRKLSIAGGLTAMIVVVILVSQTPLSLGQGQKTDKKKQVPEAVKSIPGIWIDGQPWAENMVYNVTGTDIQVRVETKQELTDKDSTKVWVVVYKNGDPPNLPAIPDDEDPNTEYQTAAGTSRYWYRDKIDVNADETEQEHTVVVWAYYTRSVAGLLETLYQRTQFKFKTKKAPPLETISFNNAQIKEGGRLEISPLVTGRTIILTTVKRDGAYPSRVLYRHLDDHQTGSFPIETQTDVMQAKAIVGAGREKWAIPLKKQGESASRCTLRVWAVYTVNGRDSYHPLNWCYHMAKVTE